MITSSCSVTDAPAGTTLSDQPSSLAVRYGLFVSAQHPAEDDPGARFAEHLEQVRFVRDAGFHSVFAGQHFLPAPFQMLQPVPLLARLAAEAGDLRVGAGILLLPLLNPVEVAEEAATLDVVTGGRFVLGVGLGYRDDENAAFGLPPERVRVYRQKLDVVRRLLEGEEVTASGHGYRLQGARLAPRPLQRPRPPIWMAANSDAAVRRAAQLADTWFVNPHAGIAEVERQLALFRVERGAEPDELPMLREACIAPTDEEALAVARPHLVRKYAAYVEWGQSDVLPPSDTLRREWEELRAGRFLVGAPEAVVEQIRALRALGVTELVLRVQWPGLPQRDALRTLELLAREVLPHA
jgi:alkanesulfonate monooxygenase SsuD/methylene tetrahydromethanopterin reductase-like flavin-dependent oxidoreductase (luciferase family)